MDDSTKAKVIAAYEKMRDAQNAIAVAEVAVAESFRNTPPGHKNHDGDHMAWLVILTAQQELQQCVPPFGIATSLGYAARYCGYEEK